MDWKRAIEEERAALMRIVTLLGALAGLAELAASRSPAMRGFVLWVLRRAEAVAQDFVAGGPDAPIASMPVRPAGTCPADAMRLALSLRALARQLERQAKRQARLMFGSRGARAIPGKVGTGFPSGIAAKQTLRVNRRFNEKRIHSKMEPQQSNRMPAIRDLATGLSMLAAFAWPIPHPAPDTS